MFLKIAISLPLRLLPSTGRLSDKTRLYHNLIVLHHLKRIDRRNPARRFTWLCIAALFLFSCERPASMPTGEKKGFLSATAAPAPAVVAPEAKGSKRILFVGNSHIRYYISIPSLFSSLCRFNNVVIREEQVVEMGISLLDIYKDHRKQVDEVCAKNDPDGNYYDYVVLQERTPIVTNNSEEYKASVRKLMSLIRQNSPGAVFLVYEMAPSRDFVRNQGEFRKLYDNILKVNREVIAEHNNTKLYRVAEAINAAYEGERGYHYLINGEDRLRHGNLTLHLLNDSGFMAAVQLYATLFDKLPEIPSEMYFTDGGLDSQHLHAVKDAVSDPEALQQIALAYR